MNAPTGPGPVEASDAELAALRRGVVLGDAVAGSTSPNPPVGAVVLDRAGRVVGEGATQPPGGQHAEVVALGQAGEAAAGGTLVCTLEPCAHHGRTGPCTEAIHAAAIGRIVFGAPDPNPVAAGGAQALRIHGVSVAGGHLMADICRSALGRWLRAIELGRPHVTWKYAATLDGRVAAGDGTSRWITSVPARADVHRMRASLDAVIVGSGTVLADDPQLTVRDGSGAATARQPVRVVFDRRGRIPRYSRVLDSSATTTVRTDAIPEALGAMFDAGMRAVLLEGGPTLAAAFLRGGYVDRVVGYLAPALLGNGPSVVGDLGITGIEQTLRLVVDDVTLIGSDVRVTAVFPDLATVIKE